MFIPTLIDLTISVVTAIVVLLIELAFVRAGKWKPSVSSPAASPTSQSGSSVSVAGNMTNSQISQNTVNQNINISQNNITNNTATSSESEASDVFGWGIGLFLIGVTVIGLGTIYAEWVLWITIGLITGIAVAGSITVMQTRRHLAAWPSGGTYTLIGLVLTAASLFVIWPRILDTTRGDISIESLRRSASPLDTNDLSVENVLEHLVSQVKWVFDKSALQGMLFLELQLLSAALVLLMCVLLVRNIWDWQTYILFSRLTTKKQKALDAADRFQEIGWVDTLVVLVVLLAAWYISGGGVYDLIPRGSI